MVGFSKIFLETKLCPFNRINQKLFTKTHLIMSASPLPPGWKRVEARRYPGCHYYLKPDGTATWLLEGQSRKDLPKQLLSVYGKDFSYDAALIEKVNPKITLGSTRRYSSYAEHPKVADAKNTFVSLKQQDFVPFQPKCNYRPPHSPYYPRPFGQTSLYRSSYAPYTIDKEGSVHSGALSAEALPTGGILADERYEISQILHGDNSKKGRSDTPSIPRDTHRDDNKTPRTIFRPSSAPQQRIARALDGLDQLKYPNLQKSTPRMPVLPSPVTVPSPPSAPEYKESVHRAFRARPKDFSHGRSIPFTSTSDYRAQYVDFKPPRPHLAHPDDQVSFGDRYNDNGTQEHPSTLYREDFKGEQPYLGKTRKAVIHAKMKGIPSHYTSRTAEEFVCDRYLPNTAFRERMRAIDAEVVKRLKDTNSLGDGY